MYYQLSWLLAVKLKWALTGLPGRKYGWLQGLFILLACKLECASESPGELVQLHRRAPPPEFLVQWIWGKNGEFAYLRSSQVMLTLLVWCLYFKTADLLCGNQKCDADQPPPLQWPTWKRFALLFQCSNPAPTALRLTSRPCDPVDIRFNQFCSSGSLLSLLAGE